MSGTVSPPANEFSRQYCFWIFGLLFDSGFWWFLAGGLSSRRLEPMQEVDCGKHELLNSQKIPIVRKIRKKLEKTQSSTKSVVVPLRLSELMFFSSRRCGGSCFAAVVVLPAVTAIPDLFPQAPRHLPESISRMRNSQGRRPLLWLVGALVGLSLFSVVDASLGDRLPEFKECVEVRN